MGGVFFAFSSFVMPALGRIPVAEGIRAMQRINVDVYHWTFMSTFFLTPIACVGIAAYAISRFGWDSTVALYAIPGCIVYVLGNFVVTAAGNVPLNNALAAVDAETADAASVWVRYVTGWTRWNHVRTAASMVAAGAFVLALKALTA
jgi:uncharacterized membrane protein